MKKDPLVRMVSGPKRVIPKGPLPGGIWKRLLGKHDKEASTSVVLRDIVLKFESPIL